MLNPEISLVVPIYNSHQTLQRCFDSLRNQSFHNFEVILVNDGSTDVSREFCEEYIKSDQRFKLINQENSGVSDARNTGVINTDQKANYICFIDSDDWVEKDFLYLLFKEIDNNETDLVQCSFNMVKTYDLIKIDAPKVSRKIISKEEILDNIRDLGTSNNNIFGNSACGKMYKREIIIENNIKFPSGLKLGEDSLFQLNYQKYINKAVILNLPLYNVNRVGESSVTSGYIPFLYDTLTDVKQKSFEINRYAISYPDEYKQRQYLRVAVQAIVNESKLLGSNDFKSVYKTIRDLQNKKEVREYIKIYKPKANMLYNSHIIYRIICIGIIRNLPLFNTFFLLMFIRLRAVFREL